VDLAADELRQLFVILDVLVGPLEHQQRDAPVLAPLRELGLDLLDELAAAGLPLLLARGLLGIGIGPGWIDVVVGVGALLRGASGSIAEVAREVRQLARAVRVGRRLAAGRPLARGLVLQ
jgi:hypothetical protein